METFDNVKHEHHWWSSGPVFDCLPEIQQVECACGATASRSEGRVSRITRRVPYPEDDWWVRWGFRVDFGGIIYRVDSTTATEVILKEEA